MANVKCEKCEIELAGIDIEENGVMVDKLEEIVYFENKKHVCEKCFKKHINRFYLDSKLVLPQKAGWLVLF